MRLCGIVGRMTPDAAGILAQVDAGVLVALVLDQRTAEKRTKDADATIENQFHIIESKGRWLYLAGIYIVFMSLSVTMISVVYNKPLTGLAAMIAFDALIAGFLPLIFSALIRIAPEVDLHSSRQMNLMLISMAAIFVWFLVWWLSTTHFRLPS